MKRLAYASISSLLLAMILLSGCGAKTSNSVSKDTVKMEDSAELSGYQLQAEEEKSTAFTDSTANTTANTNVVNDVKKIIKNATIHLEVKNADDALAKILEWVNANNGYEFSRNFTTSGSYKRINVVFKMQPDKLDGFIKFMESKEFMKNTGRITNSNIASDDITDQYYDAIARLDNLKKGREQFIKIQEKATTIDEILKVQNELNRITGEIESLQGRINMWDKMIAESTVTINITEEADPIKSAQAVSWKFSSFSEIINTMKNGFIFTANTIINIIIWLVIFIISISPLLVIVLVVMLLLKKFGKKQGKTDI